MKEIKLLELWAENVVTESAAIRMGTPMSSMGDRPIPREHDIQYKATRAHPDLSPEQALAVYMADELEKTEKVDSRQNKQIATIDKEVDTIEHDEQDIHDEIARLMQLIRSIN